MHEEYLFTSGYSVWYVDERLAMLARDRISERLMLTDTSDDAALLRAQADLSLAMAEYPRQFIQTRLDTFQGLLGPDLMIQKYPYLRIARPGKPQDNIGFHRDTLYGSSPHELSVLIPLTDMKGGAAFHVLPGSHLKPESAYPYTEGEPQCEKGSAKHGLGFVYAPKVFDAEVRSKVVPVEIKAGEMLIFFPSLIHGQEVNSSDSIRLSFDIRLCNAYAPIQKARSVHQDYYEPMSAGVTTRVAEAYASAH